MLPGHDTTPFRMDAPQYPPLIDITGPIMRAERLHARTIARARGYFWLPCPLCGIRFGGQEWAIFGQHPSSIHIYLDSPGTGIGICPWCQQAGRGYGHLHPDGRWILDQPETSVSEQLPALTNGRTTP